MPVSDVVISAIPTQMIRSYLQGPGADLPRDVPWISASKGLEKSHQALPSQILKDCGVVDEPGILSGPSHAEEVLRNLPTAVVFLLPYLGHFVSKNNFELLLIPSNNLLQPRQSNGDN